MPSKAAKAVATKAADTKAARKAVSVHSLREDQRRAFGLALRNTMEVRGLAQRALGEMLGLSQPAVSAWLCGTAEPSAGAVFLMEEKLGTAPGTLSRILGYLPTTAVKSVAGVEVAVMADEQLSSEVKAVLLGAYRAVVSRPARPRRGGRPAK